MVGGRVAGIASAISSVTFFLRAIIVLHHFVIRYTLWYVFLHFYLLQLLKVLKFEDIFLMKTKMWPL
ncbi:hypothetical protein BJV74DRAFT_869441 [Russula compacta]|nr:hypothetical protein BJV74DRAFT_869441 [Russula compacta]